MTEVTMYLLCNLQRHLNMYCRNFIWVYILKIHMFVHFFFFHYYLSDCGHNIRNICTDIIQSIIRLYLMAQALVSFCKLFWLTIGRLPTLTNTSTPDLDNVSPKSLTASTLRFWSARLISWTKIMQYMRDGALHQRSTGVHGRSSKKFGLAVTTVMIKDFYFLIKIFETSKRFPFWGFILLVD